MRKRLSIYTLILSLFVISYGCKKDKVENNNTEETWTDDENVITFIMEYNSNKLKKYSKLINDSLYQYFTYEYADTTVIQNSFNKNHEKLSSIIYFVDSFGKAILYNTFDSDSILICETSVIYSTNGFPEEFIINDLYAGNINFQIENNGEDITSEEGNMLYIYYDFFDTLSMVCVPYDLFYRITPSYSGVFGEVNQHLLQSYYQTSAGPGSIIRNYRFKYTLDSEGKVIKITKYQKEYSRNEEIPSYGIIQHINYEYI